MAITTRLRQTWQLVLAWGRTVPNERAEPWLNRAEFALFCQMPRSDRQHHLRVFDRLRQEGHDHLALLEAALLHDVGKTRFRFMLPHKVLVVLVKAFAPRQFIAWGKAEPKGWKRAFVVSAQHPAWGAEMAAIAGATPLAIELIARHQEKPIIPAHDEADSLLRLLQNADDRS